MVFLISKKSLVDYLSRRFIVGKYGRTNCQISDILFNSYINEVKQKEIFQDINLEKLHRQFNRYGVPSHLLGNEWWQNFFIASRSSNEEGLEAQTKLINIAENLCKHSIFEYWMLMYIYCLTTRFGLFTVSTALRNTSKILIFNEALKEQRLNFILLSDLISALIEDEKYDEAKYFIDIMVNVNPSKGLKFLWLYEQLTGEKLSSFELEHKYQSHNDLHFKLFVENRSIAVVSPALINTDDSEKIDSSDIVVKCNVRERKLLVDSQFTKGSRCEITYMTKKAFKTLNLEAFMELCNDDLKWLVVRQLPAQNLKKVMKIFDDSMSFDKRIYTRTTLSFDDVTFFGSGSGTGGNNLNAIPNIILDLLRFNPKNISVFHADLMITYKRFSNLYDPENSSKDVENVNRYLRSFSCVHHPEAQYLLLKQLWNRKRVSGDSSLSKVMTHDLNKYIESLQNSYGNFRLDIFRNFVS